MGLQDHMLPLCLVFQETSILFFHSGFTFYIPTKMVEDSFSVHSLQYLFFVNVFLMMAIMTSVRWYLIVVLIGIDLIISGVSFHVLLLLYTL